MSPDLWGLKNFVANGDGYAANVDVFWSRSSSRMKFTKLLLERACFDLFARINSIASSALNPSLIRTSATTSELRFKPAWQRDSDFFPKVH